MTGFIHSHGHGYGYGESLFKCLKVTEAPHPPPVITGDGLIYTYSQIDTCRNKDRVTSREPSSSFRVLMGEGTHIHVHTYVYIYMHAEKGTA
jgi:hypothetical protein